MRKNKLLLLLALLLTAVTGAWAEEQVVYTLDGTQTASNNAYTTAGVVNQGGMTWRVTGNTSMNPWRIGGKSLSGVDRSVWSESSLDETVTKVTLEFGTASSITVNSITMTVAGDAEFSDVIDTKAVTFSANNTVDVTPTEGKEWKNAYYRFVFNVTVSGGTNRFVQLKSIKFYNDPDAQQQGGGTEPQPGGGSTEPVAGTFTVSLKDGTEDAKNWSIASGEKSATGDAADGLTGLSEGDQVTIQYSGRLKVKGVKATSEAAEASIPDGAISGKFSVSDGKQVYFSKGNLRYASSKWSFFDNQYDYYTSHSADAWDHFGWSTSATTYGMSTSSNNDDYSGDFVDWGATMGTGWRTLTSDEWAYLLKTRSASTVNGTENGRYAKAKVNDVGGVILFPDTYTHPDGVAAPTGVNATDEYGWEGNSYTAADWTKMESAGCVFLPAAGCRYGSEMIGLGSYGYYGSATPDGADYAYRVKFNSGSLEPANSINRCLGCSVRLVQEVAPNP